MKQRTGLDKIFDIIEEAQDEVKVKAQDDILVIFNAAEKDWIYKINREIDFVVDEFSFRIVFHDSCNTKFT